MRKVTFGVANSLDNYIARKNQAVDWLKWSDDVSAIMRAFWKTIDTIVWGRKTYEVALRMGGPISYPGMNAYVLSHTLKQTACQGVEVISTDAVAYLRKLKKRKGKGICLMCGGELARSLLEARLIDEIGLNVHPIVLGSGIPLFRKMARQVDLELIESRVLKHGCVYLLYRVKK